MSFTYSPRSYASLFIAPLAVLLVAQLAISSCTDNKKPDARAGDKGKETSKSVAVDSTVTSSPAVTEFQSAETVTDTVSSYTFHLNPHAGDVYTYRITRKGTSRIDTISADEQMVYNFTLRVTGVNSDGSIAMQMRYDSVRVFNAIHTGPGDLKGKTFAFDSRQKSDSADRQTANYKALIGQNVNLTMSKDGEVREISNLEPIVSKLLGKMRDSIPPTALQGLREDIKLQAFQSILQQMFLQSPPDSPITLGKEWVRRDSAPMLGVPSKSTITYKLVEAKKMDGQLIGRVTVTLASEFPTRKINNPNVAASIDDIDLRGSGEALVNLASGFPVRKNTRIDISLKMTATAKVAPGKGKSQTQSQKQSTGTLVELLDFKPSEK